MQAAADEAARMMDEAAMANSGSNEPEPEATTERKGPKKSASSGRLDKKIPLSGSQSVPLSRAEEAAATEEEDVFASASVAAKAVSVLSKSAAAQREAAAEEEKNFRPNRVTVTGTDLRIQFLTTRQYQIQSIISVDRTKQASEKPVAVKPNRSPLVEAKSPKGPAGRRK